jgi:EAL domain-containing protein (putative c-di-GMP-specific phosphodiesterase class I)
MNEFKKALRKAMAEDQLTLYYQPVINLKDQSVIGVEAFLRWIHPDLGLLHPADFIAHAEASGLVMEIDDWVTRHICTQLRVWKEDNQPLVPVSINISPDTIIDQGFIKKFTAIIEKNLCDPQLIQIEINRSNRILQDDQILDHIAQLHDLGVNIAIDDFATDAANQITQIFQLPIKSLKIDRSVVRNIQDDINTQKMVSAVAAMAKILEIDLVAQGVESEDDVKMLKAQKIVFAQGFYLGAPVPALDLPGLLKPPSTARKKKK